VTHTRAREASSPFYGLAEGLVCSSAFIVPAALLWGRHVLGGWAVAQWASLGDCAAVLAFLTLLLLPFCIAMRTTIPLALWLLRRAAPAAEQRGFSRLYAANVVGGALGSLVAAFVLIEWLGFTHCLIVVAGVNSLLAVGALILSLRDQGPGASPDVAPPAAAEQARERSPALSFALVLLFATGMASMAMEIAWSRQCPPHLGNLVYSFATILAVYLSATYAGTLIYRHRRWSQSE
jgi:spermidine synthase